MLKKFQLLVILVIILMGVYGCETPESTEAPTKPATQPLPSPTTEPPTATLDLAATQAVEQTSAAKTTQEALDATASAQSAEKTQAAQEKAATRTQVAAATRTAIAESTATQQAYVDQFAAIIQDLYDQGVVGSVEGEYFQKEDWEDSQAQLNYFFPDPFMVAENFVLSADMNWSSASMKANWFASGCGFVYGMLSDQTENLTFLGLDGYVYSMGWLKGQRKPFAYQKWGSPTLPEGSARAMLVVYDKDVTIYVNGEKANHFYNSGYSPGFLALTVVSGTNAGYGTRCAMKNIEYWLFD